MLPPPAFRASTHPERSYQRLPRLHRNASLKTVALQLRCQIGRKKIPPQRHHRVINPVILASVINPEVLMRVNVHRFGPASNSVIDSPQLPAEILPTHQSLTPPCRPLSNTAAASSPGPRPAESPC